MSLREQERRKRLGAHQRMPDDDEVLTFAEWCALNKIGKRTGQQISAHPVVRS